MTATPQHPEIPDTPRIEAVLFDFGLVLSGPPNPPAWARMLTISSLDEEPFHAAYWAHRHDYDRGALTGPAYWQAVATTAGTHFHDRQVADLITADTDLWTDLNLPMVAFAQRLQHAGIRTGILSNIGDSIAEGICAKLPWLAAFHHCTWSHAWFLAKPDPAIYLRTAEALATPPAHILFIDDRADNIAAARALGMQTIQYSTHDAFLRELQARDLGWLLHPERTTAIPT